MSQYHLQRASLASLICALSTVASPVVAQTEIPLTYGDVQAFRNNVEMFLPGGLVRPVRDQDRLGFGDTIRTNLASQADIELNDGSFVRLGEATTFWFVPNTRELRLAQGTGMMVLAPDSGRTTIATPDAITETQGTTVVIRHVQPRNATENPAMARGVEEFLRGTTGRTAVMVLSDIASRGVQVSLRDGRVVQLTAGQMAIVDGEDVYLFEFNRALFYQTSYLAEGLLLPDPSVEAEAGNAESANAAATTSAFAGDYWLDPQFLSPSGDATTEGGWLFPANASPPPSTDQTPRPTVTDTSPSGADIPNTDSISTPESAIADPNTITGTTHNDFEIEEELTPTPSDPLSADEALPAPDQGNSDSLNLPAGVIAPPPESPPFDQLAEPETSPPTVDPPPSNDEAP